MDRLILRSLERHLPLNVHLDLTYRCNERCVHCYLDHEDYGEMSTAEVKRVLDELAREGALFLTFSGGEIFLRADFFELVEYARRLRFDISLKTNGLLVTPERAARLRALGVHKVNISIYSADPAVHDAITRVPGSLEKSLAAVRLLKSLGLRVKLACPLMQQNLASLRGIQALADELGVPYMLDLTITPRMDGDMSLLRLRLSAEAVLPILSDPRINPPLEARAEAAKTAAGPAAYDNIPCSAGQNSAYISPYGDVYPCVQMPVAAGNVRRQGFREIWYGSQEMQRVRDVRENMIRICNQCEIRAFCQRCPGLAHMEDGDLLGPSSRACELAEASARAAGVAQPVSAWRQLRQKENFSPGMAGPAKERLVNIALVSAH
jgi:radical SAM protein with 4Fe4S-binding SPASM domain